MSDTDPMAEIRASFFIECEELLEALQDGLTQMDDGSGDAETINICFRAVHSMKGGGGAFGLEQLVRFAHRYETVMDEVRAGRLTPDRDAMMLFFSAADVLSDIVRASRDGEDLDGTVVEATLRELEALTGASPDEDEQEEEIADFQPMGLSMDLDFDLGDDGDAAEVSLPDLPDLGGDATTTGLPVFVVTFTPERELFTSGNEPRHLLRALMDLGTGQITCDATNVPPLDTLDPEGAFLSWTVRLETDRSAQDLEEVFDFVEGLCTLKIETEGPSIPDLPDLPDLASLPETVPDDAGETDASQPVAPRGRLTLSEPSAAPAHPPKTVVDKTDPPPPPRPAKTGTSPSPAAASQPKATVRVDLERIDRLVNLVGELVINQAMLSQSVAEAGLPANSAVVHGLEEFMQLTRDIQDSVMMIRAQPVKSLFQRMSRIVRESSGAVGKRVRLVTDGESTEVDKTVIERLADPLTHMIRNAVDHGLEDGETRLANGKSEEGLVTLTAAHRSGRVVIEISDDGGGINRPKVRQIAESKGLIAEGLTLSDSEIDALLFLPGFSTASEVSDLSGRGVGMDVVRSSIQALGGRISISSEPGTGTTFSISLPLTLAVLDGMVVKSAGETLVVPLSAIIETLTVQDDDVRALGPETQVLHVRDAFVPLVDLATELGFRDPSASYEGSVVLLIAQEDGARSALIVDRIEEQRQVVIKGLQESYGHVPGIAAATILGDGQIALILDPIDLMANATGRTRPNPELAACTG